MFRILFFAGALSSLAACAWSPAGTPMARPGWRASAIAAPGFHFDWLLSGDPAVAPMQVFDDGRETWLQFAPGQALPAILGVAADGERVLPLAHRDPYVVVAGRWQALVFRGGRLAAQARRASPGDGSDEAGHAGVAPRVQAGDNPL